MSKAKKDHRPHRTTMEGIIWNANHVLDEAISAMTNGLPYPVLRRCKAIVLVSVVEAGLIFSGNVGSGIIMLHKKDGSWSPPAALGMLGIGFGALIGKGVKDIVVMIMEEDLLRMLETGNRHLRLHAQHVNTEKEVGRNDSYESFSSGYEGSVSIIYSRGHFYATSLEAVTFDPKPKVNKKFYGKAVTGSQIMTEDGAVEVPEGTGITTLYEKLAILMAGKTKELTKKELERKETLRIEAMRIGEEDKAKEGGDDVVFVDAEKEAAKEL